MDPVRPRHARRLAIAFATALALFCPPPQAAEELAEHEVKAAFLYRFSAFVEWPGEAFEGSDTPFRIGVCGDEALAAELARVVAGRSAADRSLQVRRVSRPEQLEGLHMLFVGRAEAQRLPELLAAAKGRPMLVVTDFDNALSRGSMINFVVVQDKVRFDVATAAAEQGRLRISSRLLAVARQRSSP
jgi:hypothetical protein